MLLSWPDITGIKAELPTNIEIGKTLISKKLSCKPECLQFVASPILEKGETIAHLLISRPITEPIITFNQLTESEIVILSSIKYEEAQASSSLKYLSKWDKFISAITHPEITYIIIKQLENSVSLQSLLKNPHQENIENEWYELYRSAIRLDDIYVFVINRITDNKKQITAAAFNSILIGFSGLVLSEALLIFMLGGPVSRLVNLARNLPLLVEGEYQLLRDKLQHDQNPKKFANEIDITLDAATDLARIKAEQDLIWLADHDTLTELINRRRFQSDFEAILNQAKRYQHLGALLFIDLDAFKEINDLSGHLAGDNLLRKVSDAMRELVRKTDLLARLGEGMSLPL